MNNSHNDNNNTDHRNKNTDTEHSSQISTLEEHSQESLQDNSQDCSVHSLEKHSQYENRDDSIDKIVNKGISSQLTEVRKAKNENSDNGHIRVRGQSVRAKGKELQQLTAELKSMIKEQR